VVSRKAAKQEAAVRLIEELLERGDAHMEDFLLPPAEQIKEEGLLFKLQGTAPVGAVGQGDGEGNEGSAAKKRKRKVLDGSEANNIAQDTRGSTREPALISTLNAHPK
jgi:hypothetical protein